MIALYLNYQKDRYTQQLKSIVEFNNQRICEYRSNINNTNTSDEIAIAKGFNKDFATKLSSKYNVDKVFIDDMVESERSALEEYNLMKTRLSNRKRRDNTKSNRYIQESNFRT